MHRIPNEPTCMGSNHSNSRSSNDVTDRDRTETPNTSARGYRYNTRSRNRNNNNILTVMDSDDSDLSDFDIHLRRPSTEELISVFQVLIRNGQIHIMSSEDDSGDEYSPTTSNEVKPPRDDYKPDTSVLEQNDLALVMKKDLALHTVKNKSLPHLLCAREIGSTSHVNGFDKPRRNLLSETFLPNTVRRIDNYGYKAFCGTYSKTGDVFLSAAQDRGIRIYDTANDDFKKIKKINARDVGWSVLDTAFSPDGRSLVYSSWSECIHLCNIYGDIERHEALPLSPDNRRFCIFSLAFSEDGTEILGGSNDGYLYIYNLEQKNRILKLAAHENDVNTVAFADYSTHILFSAADDGLCKVWDRRTLRESDPQPVGTLAGHIDGITFIDSKGDGRYLITNSKDQSIKLWDMRRFASESAISNTKRMVADQNWDYRWQRVPKKLCVQREALEGDVSIMTYRGHSVLNTLIRCRFSPSHSTGQRYIYTGCAAGRVVIYDLLTGKIVKLLKGHRSCVRDVSWHPTRLEIVSTSWDNSLGLWTYEGNHCLDSDEEVCSIQSSDGTPIPRRSTRLAQKRARHEQTN